MEIKSIQTKKIYKNIVEQIVNLIWEGSLKCGDKLPPERALAEMLNVSRASLREALSVMEIMGIIDIRPGEGSFVSDLNIRPFLSLVLPLMLKLKDTRVEEDLVEFRKILESSSIRFVVNNLVPAPEKIKELEDLVEEMKDAKEDMERSIKLDIQFHKTLFTLSDNVILITVMEYVEFILGKTVKYNRVKLWELNSSAQDLYEQHKAIVDAVKERDGDLAAKNMEIHLNYINQVL
ncbi:MAG: FadR family transcriptional regulator [Clostridiales bacterium]|nr:FadR family transcriptional regulator [Clostridiales bacterium]